MLLSKAGKTDWDYCDIVGEDDAEDTALDSRVVVKAEDVGNDINLSSSKRSDNGSREGWSL